MSRFNCVAESRDGGIHASPHNRVTIRTNSQVVGSARVLTARTPSVPSVGKESRAFYSQSLSPCGSTHAEGSPRARLIRACLAVGMNGHVSKPIDPSALFDTLERFVAPTARGPAVPPQEPVPTPTAEAGELPDVPGLNTREGLMRVAGNKKLYVKLLRQFSKTEADAAQRIASALAKNDRALAERLAHSVKGAAGNLGASAVQNAAAKLEKAIASSAPAAEIEVWRASLEECLGSLIRGLETALEGQDGERDSGRRSGAGEAGCRTVVALPGRFQCRRDRLFRDGGASLADPLRRTQVRTFCQLGPELCVLRSVRGTDGGRGEEMNYYVAIVASREANASQTRHACQHAHKREESD